MRLYFSGLCVFVGLSGLFFFKIDYIQSVAISGMIVVIMSILFSLTLLPALLSLIGKRILKESVAHTPAKAWRKFAKFVMKHPIAMIIVVTTFIVICLLPLRTANLQFLVLKLYLKRVIQGLHMKSMKKHLMKLSKHTLMLR